MRRDPRLGLFLALLLATPARAEVVELVNGDRITGKVVAKGTRRIRVQTPYGLLSIPRNKVERIRADDGTEELITPPPAPEPVPTPSPSPAALVVSVGGDSFWQAWDPKAPPADPSLRLEVRLDGHAIVSYLDPNLDPEDLPKAIVNSFIFSAEQLFLLPTEGVLARPPEVREGRVYLDVELPAALAGRKRLDVAYQVNEASAAEPQWRSLVEGGAEVELKPGSAVHVRVDQERGQIEYTRHLMRQVETFRALVLVQDEPP